MTLYLSNILFQQNTMEYLSLREKFFSKEWLWCMQMEMQINNNMRLSSFVFCLMLMCVVDEVCLGWCDDDVIIVSCNWQYKWLVIARLLSLMYPIMIMLAREKQTLLNGYYNLPPVQHTHNNDRTDCHFGLVVSISVSVTKAQLSQL